MSVANDSPPVNDMADVKTITKQHVGLERVAQTLADACRARAGLPTARLATCPPREMQWYRSTAAQLVGIYLAIVEGRRSPPEVVQHVRLVPAAADSEARS